MTRELPCVSVEPMVQSDQIGDYEAILIQGIAGEGPMVIAASVSLARGVVGVAPLALLCTGTKKLEQQLSASVRERGVREDVSAMALRYGRWLPRECRLLWWPFCQSDDEQAVLVIDDIVRGWEVRQWGLVDASVVTGLAAAERLPDLRKKAKLTDAPIGKMEFSLVSCGSGSDTTMLYWRCPRPRSIETVNRVVSAFPSELAELDLEIL